MKVSLLAGLLASGSVLFGAATLAVTPPVIYDCSNGFATATLTWTGASGPVNVRVLQKDGPSTSGVVDPSGSITTGSWVVDSMPFFLVNQSGTVEATATARVRCGGSARTIDQGLSGGSYFPLQLGNTWVYRYNSRLVTNNYLVQAITGTEVINGQTYYVLTQTYEGKSALVMKLRGDNNGVIYKFNETMDVPYVNPAPPAQRTSYAGAIGKFDEALFISTFEGLGSNSFTFVRGLGLASSRSSLATGSSGGFTDGLELVEARIDGIVLALSAARLALAIENPDLDLTNQKAPNCAVPCYFTACGLAPGSDPPGTYRPCVETRVESSYTAAHSVQLQLFNPAGTLVFDTRADVDPAGGVRYVRLPLYTSLPQSLAFNILPPGLYKLAARMLLDGAEVGIDSLTIRIR